MTNAPAARLPVAEEEGIRLILAALVPAFHPLRVILFGSRARGEAEPDSDYDLLVVVDDAPDRVALTIQILAALADLPLFKDVVVTTPAEIARRGDSVGGVLRPALREGRAIYERS